MDPGWVSFLRILLFFEITRSPTLGKTHREHRQVLDSDRLFAIVLHFGQQWRTSIRFRSLCGKGDADRTGLRAETAEMSHSRDVFLVSCLEPRLTVPADHGHRIFPHNMYHRSKSKKERLRSRNKLSG